MLCFNKFGLRISESEKTIQGTDCKAGGGVMCICITT